MSLRRRVCSVLRILQLHSPECVHCAPRLCEGLIIGRRLRELNEHAQWTDKNPDKVVETCGNNAA